MHVFAAGILFNKSKQTYHPIFYRHAPTASERTGDPKRCKSIGHHTEGFPTAEAAEQFLTTDERSKNAILLLTWLDVWDGEDVPARVIYL